jgi:hypothetical protein
LSTTGAPDAVVKVSGSIGCDMFSPVYQFRSQ